MVVVAELLTRLEGLDSLLDEEETLLDVAAMLRVVVELLEGKETLLEVVGLLIILLEEAVVREDRAAVLVANSLPLELA